nr:ribonuclease H-like domain-containing protein [Tanacetum cinerariifolium]
MFDLTDVFELNLTVGHLNGTLAKITHVGNLRLNDNVVLFDVLVIPEYTVSLLFMNNLIKDIKINVCFDETKCYIQDLKKEKVPGTGRESDGLYLFDTDCAKSAMCLDSKFLVCHVSKDVWHNRLGHLANQVLKLLKGSLNLSNIDHNGPCEVCHNSKQTRESFPLSEHKTTSFGKLIHLDVWGPYKVVSKEGFREPNISQLRSFRCLCFATVVKGSDEFSHSPNDDEKGPSSRDGRVQQPVSNANIGQLRDAETYPATPLDENNMSEGNVEEVGPRRSQRVSKFPAKLNEFVLDDKVNPKRLEDLSGDVNNAFFMGI